MSDLRDLYQEVIFDHNRQPRNFQKIETANRKADGYNPLCGDKITVYLVVEDGVIRDVGFQGCGCAISTASASMMTETLKGRTVEEARQLFETFHDLVAGNEARAAGSDLGKLKVLAGVRDYPSRVKCATLAWHTVKAALDQADEPVSTE